jgi:uncharacterized protein YcbX
MKMLGTVKEIWRYPVKGMAGEKVQQCELSKWGLTKDRTWALWDINRQEIQSCKFRPELLMCSASSRTNPTDPHVDITFPCGTRIGSDDTRIHQKLSDLVGFESTLMQLESNLDMRFFKRYKGAKEGWLEELKNTFSREQNEPYPDFSNLPPEIEEYVTVPGSFFLVAPFHIITTATLTHLQKSLPKSDWDTRRFRPNLIIDTGNEPSGLVEQEWLQQCIKIARSEIDCTSTTPRCGAITRSQQTLAFDKKILRTVIKEANQNVGIYGAVTTNGEICVGDNVTTI